MATKEYTLTITEVVDGVFEPVTAGTYYLRVDPFSSNTYTGTHSGDGVWSFGVVADGIYQLWDGSAKVAKFGTRWIGDESIATYIHVDGSSTISANIPMNSFKFTGLGQGSNDDDSVTYEQLTNLQALCALLAEDNYFVGANDFSGGSIIVPDGYTAGSSAAASQNYVDYYIASVVTQPFQESTLKRRVIVGGTAETNKVYLTVQTAVASCTTPTTDKRYIIELVSSGTATKFISATTNAATMVNYVDFKGLGAYTNLILGGATGSASLTKYITMTNLIIWLGNGDITSARTFQNFTFKDCIFYAFNDITFNACKLYNCYVYQGAGLSVTLTGAAEVMNCCFMQEIDTSGITTGFVANTSSEVSTGYTMPDDPTVE
jgi:hypothetical protein